MDPDDLPREPLLPERRWLLEQIAAMEARLAALDAATGRTPATPPPPIRAGVVPPPPGAASTTPVFGPPPPAPPAPPAPPTSPVLAPSRSINQSGPPAPMTFPGVDQLLKWSGAVLLFLSAVFLVSTSIQRGWIGPELQLVGAASIGAALISGGLHLAAKRPGWDLPLVGAGLAVLAACAGAGWAWLELGQQTLWIVATLAVLGLGASLTVKLRQPLLGLTSMLSVLLAAATVLDGVGEFAVFTAVTSVTMAAVAARIRRPLLHVLTAGVVLPLFLPIGAIAHGIAEDSTVDPAAGFRTVGAGLVVTLLFWWAPLWLERLAPPTDPVWRGIAGRLPLALPTLFGGGIALALGWSVQDTGLWHLALGGVAIASAALVWRLLPANRSLAITQGLGGLAALGIGSVERFDGPALLASLTAQAVVLLLLRRHVDDRLATLQAGVTAVAAGALTARGLLIALSTDLRFVDDALHLVVVALIGAWAWFEHQAMSPSESAGDPAPTSERAVLLGATAYLGLLVWPWSALAHLAQGQALVSAMWAAVGLASVGAGVLLERRAAANTGLATLALLIAKLLTVDLATVDTFWRVLLFFVLGGVFLVVGYRLTRPQELDALDPPAAGERRPSEEATAGSTTPGSTTR